MTEGISGVPEDVQLAMVMDVLRGATENISIPISWLMIELAKNPDIQEQIYQQTKFLLSSVKPLSYKDIQQQHYLKACLKELFRTRPLNSFLMRKLSVDVDLHSGYQVPAGTMTFMLIQDYDKEKYFPDFEKWKPERWMKKRATKGSGGCPIGVKDEMVEKNTELPKFIVVPFGHGPRSCIGRRIGENLMTIYMMKLVNKYFIQPTREFDSYFNFFVKPKGQLRIRLEKRR